MALADENSDKRQDHEDPSRPGDERDADSWVDQWSSLFDDPIPGGTQPPTREMPVLSPEQPPVGGTSPRGTMPGHLDPAEQAKRRAAKAAAEAAEAEAEAAERQAKELAADETRVEEVPAEDVPAETVAAKYQPRGGAEDAEPTRQGRPARESRDASEMEAWQKAQERTKRRAKLRANQRKAQVMQRQLPEQNDLRIEEPLAVGPSGPQRSNNRAFVAVGGVLLALAVAVAGYLFTGLGNRSDDPGTDSIAVGPTASLDDELQVGAEVAPRGISELALSTVQLLGLNDDLEPECAGSGVIVKADGTILTNAHVVTSQASCAFTSIGVGITVDSSSPSQVLYRADVLAVDEALDLAVLRITGMLDPDSDDELPAEFPSAPLGDSDTVELGDSMRILGYPVIGGETITLTTGTVSGFTAQAGIGARALIKTDATISAGNSGGMAIDPDGRVIGIPTKARASESGPAIDCRPLADTNDDGIVDEDDNCVSVGGFLNGIRPINLAIPLLGEAVTTTPLDAVPEQAEQRPEIDFEAVVVDNPRFALGRDGNNPVDETVTAQAGIAELCFFVDWQGIPVGSIWDGVWFVDGTLEEALGFTGQEWTIEENGRNFWLCAQEQNADGLPSGIYEIGFFLEGVLLFVEAIELTEEPVEPVEITWTNGTEGEICELAINPLTESGQVGLNELEEGVSIPPGGSRTLELPPSTVIAEAYNCDGEPVADAFDGLPIEETATFLIGL